MMDVISTKYGKVKGNSYETYRTFFGVPFAKAPVGQLRFEPPKEPDCYEGILEAFRFKEKAIQQELGHLPLWGKEFYQNSQYNVKPSEDCLYLNIWAPKEEGPHPVAVWIHGGAYKNGYPSEMEFDGQAYAEQGVILITIAYRLNLFGFLPTPGDGHRDNLGLQDQIMALKWIYENIEAFGGDKENITVFGQSAGAMSTLFLCNSPLTKGYIHKAIMQSGAVYKASLNETMNREKGKKVYEDLLKAADCKNLEELKQIPALELYEIFDKLPIMKEVEILAPVLDDYVVPVSVDESVSQGKMHQIPYMMGANKDDMWMENATKEKPVGELWDGMCRLAKAMADQGNQTYVYYFAHDLPGNEEGAFHSAELWYTFGTLGRCFRPMTKEDYALSKTMVEHWANFMKTGNPNGGSEILDTKAKKWMAYPEGYTTYL